MKLVAAYLQSRAIYVSLQLAAGATVTELGLLLDESAEVHSDLLAIAWSDRRPT